MDRHCECTFVSLEMIIALVSLGTYAFLGMSESV